MLDSKIITFLTVCQCKSYTKAAQKLYITQPAVSQQIKALEEMLGVSLFQYKNKALSLTKAGTQLYYFAASMQSDIQKEKAYLSELSKQPDYYFGATRTIGDYVMPNLIQGLLEENPERNIHITVNNTHALLDALREGKLDFALIEGIFDKTKYQYRLFSKESFIAVCSPNAKYAKGSYHINDLIQARLLIREQGSGTRKLFENYLHENNLSTEMFQNTCEIGSVSVIKKLMEHEMGISFMFQKAVEEELNTGLVAQINVVDFPIEREFHFVWLKNSHFSKEYESFFACLYQMYHAH